MDIIQIRTIGAWKGAQERSGKPCSCYLVHSHAFYKEWMDISRKCVAIVNHKRVVYWVNNYTKMKYMLGKHDAWCGAMVWPHRGLVKMSSCTPFINWTITEEVPCFREGKSPRLKGNPNFRPSLSFSFFPTINIPPQMQRVQIWHFSGLIYHIYGIMCII